MSEPAKTDLNIIMLSSVGSILEAYDFIIYLLLADILSVKFFNGTDLQKLLWIYLILAIGYVARPIGGLVFGHLGDKYGRKSIFLSTILIMSVATCAIGIIPEYSRIGIMAPVILILCRLFQGIALGGEIPGAIVFVYEHISEQRKNFGIASIVGGVYLGVLLASVVFAIVKSSMPDNRLLLIGWKIPFLLGGVFGGICYLIMAISTFETPVFLKMKETSQVVKHPILTIFTKFKTAIVLGLILVFSVDNIVTFFFSLFPGFLSQVHKYKFAETYFVNIINISIFVIVLFTLGYVRKKFFSGMSKFIIMYIAFSIVSSFILYYVYLHSINLIIVFFVFLSMISAVLLPEVVMISTELFPPNVRYSGVAATFNIANAVIGGFTPFAVTWLTYHFNGYAAPSFFMVSMAVLGIMMIYLITLYKKRIRPAG